MIYHAVVHKSEDTDFTVEFPDFPGCITAGDNLDEAHTMATEALELHIEAMAENGHNIPVPMSMSEASKWLESNKDGDTNIIISVSVPDTYAKTVRINITMAANLLAAVDQKAQQRHLTRSAFLADACKAMLQSG
jgi:predicted RNase H-like HicB family nuclease